LIWDAVKKQWQGAMPSVRVSEKAYVPDSPLSEWVPVDAASAGSQIRMTNSIRSELGMAG